MDISPTYEYLQVASFELQVDKKFQPHYHIFYDKITKITQESWVVLKGKVKVYLYDLDQTIIAEEILEEGDLSITFCGGHNYEILEDGTKVYEFKSGPYLSQELDKEFIK